MHRDILSKKVETGTLVKYQRIDRPCERTVVVGDIHGCTVEFEELCRAVRFGPRDVLVTAGDFLARGPGSWEVARFLRDTPNAFSVLGNHEWKIAGTIRGTLHKGWSQKQALATLDPTQWEEWAGFLEDLPAVIETPHALITHARLDPSLPVDEQDPHFTAAAGGAAVWIELDDHGVPRWFSEVPLVKPLCIGHIGYSRLDLVPRRLYAVDTRAVRGGMLTAVAFPGGQITQVPARRNYYEEAAAVWKPQQLPAEADWTD